jgi:hypothetical protein
VDVRGAFFLIGGPANYNGRLVLWDRRYRLTPPSPRQEANRCGGFDGRAVYQFYCQNLPLAREMAFPLNMALEPNNALTAHDVARG